MLLCTINNQHYCHTLNAVTKEKFKKNISKIKLIKLTIYKGGGRTKYISHLPRDNILVSNTIELMRCLKKSIEPIAA